MDVVGEVTLTYLQIFCLVRVTGHELQLRNGKLIPIFQLFLFTKRVCVWPDGK